MLQITRAFRVIFNSNGGGRKKHHFYLFWAEFSMPGGGQSMRAAGLS